MVLLWHFYLPHTLLVIVQNVVDQVIYLRFDAGPLLAPEKHSILSEVILVVDGLPIVSNLLLQLPTYGLFLLILLSLQDLVVIDEVINVKGAPVP